MDFLASIRRDSDRFYAVADDADPTLPVASCPEWNVGDLVWHLAEVHWFWASDIELKPSDPDELERVKPPRPETYAATIAFGRAQVDRLLSLLEAHADDVPVWTWALKDEDHNVGFIRRHQVQEAAVHRWDIEDAATADGRPIAPDAAADSIDETLAITLPWSARPDKPLPGTVHLHCTDTEGEWFVQADGSVERTHAKGDVALRGAASDLLLAIYKRVPLTAVEVIGDATLADDFLARIGTD
jgi:uncharacterized protein (TIGR03083 family)